ncbi:hypothetical protein RAA17_08360 [Komagataeibacter rhaeticus]|nr:hypothetical protein [Komagataeibacter rhaeticus]
MGATLCGALAAMAVGLHGARPAMSLGVLLCLQLAWTVVVARLVRRTPGLHW